MPDAHPDIAILKDRFFEKPVQQMLRYSLEMTCEEAPTNEYQQHMFS